MRVNRSWKVVLGLLAMGLAAGCGSSDKAVDLGGHSSDVTISKSTGALEVRFVNSDKSPYADQTVLVSGTKSRATVNSVSTRTDSLGFVRLGNLPPGSYQLLAGSAAFKAPVVANDVTNRLFNLGSPNTVREDLGQLYVLNGLAKTLSVIDADRGTISNNLVKTGLWPNQVAFYKGIGYIVNSGDNNVQRFNPATGKTIDTIDMGSGANPYAIAFHNDKAYVSCLMTNTVTVINLSAGTATVGKSIGVGKAPEGLAVANGRIFVACTNFSYSAEGVSYGPGAVTVIDGGNDTVAATLQLAEKSNPQALAVGADGNVYVLCTGDFATVGSQVLRINAGSLALDGAALPLTSGGSAVTTAGAIAVAPNGRGFIGDPATNRVHVIDTKDNKVLRTGKNALDKGVNPLGVCATANGVVWVFNFSADQVQSFDQGSYAQRFAPLNAGDGPQTGAGRKRGIIAAAR